MRLKRGKKGQVTLFVIIALVLIGGIATYFLVRNSLGNSTIHPDLAPVFSYYQSCMEQELSAALDLAGSQGGHVVSGAYKPGTEYAPFSSHLNFLGFGIPYWYSVTGNGLSIEDVPLKNEVASELEDYVAEHTSDCAFDSFYEQGYTITLGDVQVETTIEDSQVLAHVDAPLTVSKGELSARKSSYDLAISSSFGELYDTARELYELEKSESFLENYTLDVLRLYAPVDGTELSCSPQVWKTNEVFDELSEGLVNNLASLRFGSTRASLSNEERYFTVDYTSDASINVLYNADWPSRLAVYGGENNLLMARPIGNQEGLGIIGFCYAPYHFVYDISYPVLFQVWKGTEVFQFPVVVVIDKNLPRSAAPSTLEGEELGVDICSQSTESVSVKILDSNLSLVNGASVQYTCFDQSCSLGISKDGVAQGSAPSCLNGYLEVEAEGYAPHKQLFSTNSEHQAEIILDRTYPVSVALSVGGKPLNGSALVFFEGTASTSTYLPNSPQVALSEGLYNISVLAYGASSIVIPASKKTQCEEVPRSGLFGMFGATKEECFEITLPQTNLSSALIGGGNVQTYIFATELENGVIALDVPAFPLPTNLDQLQYNFEFVSTQTVGITFDIP